MSDRAPSGERNGVFVRRGMRLALAAAMITACTDAAVSNAVGDGGSGDGGGSPPDATATDAGGTADSSAADAGGCTSIDAASLDPKVIQQGKSLLLQYNCAECHGLSMAGNPDGIAVPGYGMAYPPNLTPDPTTGVACWSDDQLENAILFGIDNQGGRLCAPMPLFANQGMDVVSAHAIVHFLRSLPAVVSQVPDTTCTASDGGDDGSTDAAADGSVDAPADGPSDAGSDAHFRLDAHGGGDAPGADAGTDSGGGADAADDAAGDAAGE